MRLLVLALVVLPGCKLFFPAPTPMTAQLDVFKEGKAKCLVVLLPGAGDTGAAFREEGFVEMIRKSGVSADIVAADATLGYYIRGSAPQRIEEDVVAPLRARGYEQVWVFGISMGGFGSLHYTQSFPEHVDGVFSLAPWLGAPALAEEIKKAGGLEKWTPDPPAPINEENYQRQLWSFLHRVTTTHTGPELYLGYGDQDSLGVQDGVLANALPKDHVFSAPGGHDWPPWRKLLEQFLAASEFQRRCAPTPR